MIKFNGVNMPDVDIIDIQIGAPEIDQNTIKIPRASKVHVGNKTYSSRTIDILYRAKVFTNAEKEALRNQVLEWAEYNTEQQLELDSPSDKYIMATCAGHSAFNQSSMTAGDFSISFKCQPYFISKTEKTAEVGTLEVPIPFTVDGARATAAVGSIVQNVTDAITNPKWKINSDGYIQLVGTFENTTINIDLEKQLAKKYSETLMPEPVPVTLASRYFDLTKGTHTITGTDGAAGTVKWKERWL